VAVDVGRLRFLDLGAGASESSSTTKSSISSMAPYQISVINWHKLHTIIIIIIYNAIKTSYKDIIILLLFIFNL